MLSKFQRLMVLRLSRDPRRTLAKDLLPEAPKSAGAAAHGLVGKSIFRRHPGRNGTPATYSLTIHGRACAAAIRAEEQAYAE
jgi:hypothetical protein